MSQPSGQTDVRLAELLAALSLVVDLGMGQLMEHVLRQTLVALRLGELLGLTERDRGALYYVSLLAWVGCGSDSHQLATWFGDDLAWRAASYEVDPNERDALAFLQGRAAAVNPPLLGAEAQEQASLKGTALEHCVVTMDFAERLGLGPDVAEPLMQLFERWDGRGRPNRLAGADIAVAARIVPFADLLIARHRLGGVAGAVDAARQRAGTQFDPVLVDLFSDHAQDILGGLTELDSWSAVLAAEPRLRVPLTAGELDTALEAIGDFTDLKSPYLLGHARNVSDLATRAARGLGLPPPDVALVRRAALVQDAGRMGISNSIWDKPGPLSAAQLERVRLHPYYVERMLQQPPTLARIGALAAQHHERIDGSGYPRGLTGNMLSVPARILAAADVYRALVEPRPHRPPLDAAAADRVLRGEVTAGRLDGDAAQAVLRAAGHRVPSRRTWPAGLTSREVEVLGLIARGHSNRQVARRLNVAEKTVSHHVAHVYTKIGTSTRAEASLFAMRYGLLDAVFPSER